MVSLWGSKGKDNGHASQDEDVDGESGTATTTSEPPPNRSSEEATERTRLLPRHDRGVGYLSPDDPAVR